MYIDIGHSHTRTYTYVYTTVQHDIEPLEGINEPLNLY